MRVSLNEDETKDDEESNDHADNFAKGSLYLVEFFCNDFGTWEVNVDSSGER